ncbi:hypothetical protein NFJ02_03g99600 [Pycnococcus provasolii]
MGVLYEWTHYLVHTKYVAANLEGVDNTAGLSISDKLNERGISEARKQCVRAGYTGDGLMLFLRAFGRWKKLDSMLKYIVIDKEEFVRALGGADAAGTQPQASSDVISAGVRRDRSFWKAEPALAYFSMWQVAP